MANNLNIFFKELPKKFNGLWKKYLNLQEYENRNMRMENTK